MMVWFRLAAFVGAAYLCLGCTPLPRVNQEDYCYADTGMCFVLSYFKFRSHLCGKQKIVILTLKRTSYLSGISLYIFVRE